MILRSVLAASALSLGASAFLVVPEIQPHAVDNAPAPQDLHRFEAHDARTQQVALACDECPFPEVHPDGQISWTDGVKSSLLLNISAKDNALFVNDDQVFPLPPPPLNVNAVQRRESDGQETAPISLGFALEAMPLMPPQDDMELLSVRFTVLDLAGHPVPVDTLAIAVIKTATGELFIARTEIEATAADRLSWSQCRGEPRCLRRLLFARIQALMAAAKARMMSVGAKLPFRGKGCHGKPHLTHRPHGEHPADFDHRPHHFGRPHRHPHHRHGWHRTFSRVVRFIVVPAVLGVLAGLAASAIGMLVGQVIVFLWLRYRRCTNDSRSAATVEQGSTMEKAALMSEEEPPAEELPPYSDEEHGAAVPPADTK
ncbi:hypothetical protein VTN96DRAFT_4546 [Rasamsonia emersonii]